MVKLIDDLPVLSDFGLRNLDFRFRSSDFGLPASIFRLRTSDFSLPASVFGLPASVYQPLQIEVYDTK